MKFFQRGHDLEKTIAKATSNTSATIPQDLIDIILNACSHEIEHSYGDTVAMIEMRIQDEDPLVALKALSLLHIFIREPSGNGLAAASRRPELRKMMELRLNCRDLFEYNAASFILAYARYLETYLCFFDDYGLNIVRLGENRARQVLIGFPSQNLLNMETKILYLARQLLMIQKEDLSISAAALEAADYLYLDLCSFIPAIYQSMRILVECLLGFDMADIRNVFNAFLEYGEIVDRIHSFVGIFAGQTESTIIGGIEHPPLPEMTQHIQVRFRDLVADLSEVRENGATPKLNHVEVQNEILEVMAPKPRRKSVDSNTNTKSKAKRRASVGSLKDAVEVRKGTDVLHSLAPPPQQGRRRSSSADKHRPVHKEGSLLTDLISVS